jgi:hypothetical protein
METMPSCSVSHYLIVFLYVKVITVSYSMVDIGLKKIFCEEKDM